VRGEPAGFVETCENISERRRSEDHAKVIVRLMNELLATSSTSRVLALGLDAALHFEDAKSGCVFSVDPQTGARELVAHRGLLDAELWALARPEREAVWGSDAPGALVRTSVLCQQHVVAELVVKLPSGAQDLPDGRPNLEMVASVLALALARIKQERLRGDAGVNIERILATIPVAAICVDRRGAVTSWNRASEQMFGWRGHEVQGRPLPFVPGSQIEQFLSLVAEAAVRSDPWEFTWECVRKDGTACSVSFRPSPIHDVMGDGSSHLLVGTAVEAQADADESDLSGAVGSEAVVAARGAAQLLKHISLGLASTQIPLQAAEGAGRNRFENLPAGSMSISWTRDGTVDVHLSAPADNGAGSEPQP
jgi:PAS domain S-box-containing protein